MENALATLPGVAKVTADSDKLKATVELDPKEEFDVQAALTALEELKMPGTVVEDEAGKSET